MASHRGLTYGQSSDTEVIKWTCLRHRQVPGVLLLAALASCLQQQNTQAFEGEKRASSGGGKARCGSCGGRDTEGLEPRQATRFEHCHERAAAEPAGRSPADAETGETVTRHIMPKIGDAASAPALNVRVQICHITVRKLDHAGDELQTQSSLLNRVLHD
jgi:hypothetical protein